MDKRVDFSKVPLKVFYKYFTSKMDFPDTIEFLNQTVDGGIMDLPATELPSIMSEFILEYSEYTATIAIAMGSMNNYLKGNEDK